MKFRVAKKRRVWLGIWLGLMVGAVALAKKAEPNVIDKNFFYGRYSKIVPATHHLIEYHRENVLKVEVVCPNCADSNAIVPVLVEDQVTFWDVPVRTERMANGRVECSIAGKDELEALSPQTRYQWPSYAPLHIYVNPTVTLDNFNPVFKPNRASGMFRFFPTDDMNRFACQARGEFELRTEIKLADLINKPEVLGTPKFWKKENRRVQCGALNHSLLAMKLADDMAESHVFTPAKTFSVEQDLPGKGVARGFEWQLEFIRGEIKIKDGIRALAFEHNGNCKAVLVRQCPEGNQHCKEGEWRDQLVKFEAHVNYLQAVKIRTFAGFVAYAGQDRNDLDQITIHHGIVTDQLLRPANWKASEDIRVAGKNPTK